MEYEKIINQTEYKLIFSFYRHCLKICLISFHHVPATFTSDDVQNRLRTYRRTVNGTVVVTRPNRQTKIIKKKEYTINAGTQ